jgi:hypothetical protein
VAVALFSGRRTRSRGRRCASRRGVDADGARSHELRAAQTTIDAHRSGASHRWPSAPSDRVLLTSSRVARHLFPPDTTSVRLLARKRSNLPQLDETAIVDRIRVSVTSKEGTTGRLYVDAIDFRRRRTTVTLVFTSLTQPPGNELALARTVAARLTSRYPSI